MLARLFDECCSDIEAAYVRLGHSLGWRFLTSPKSTLSPSTRIAMVTLNPGGRAEPPDHGRESSEAGSAYVVERWKEGFAPGEAPLQRQVRELFSRLAGATGSDGGDTLLRESLTGYFVPFRSPTLAALPHRKESMQFATDLWARIFREVHPRLIVTIDAATTRALSGLIAEGSGSASVQAFPVGWGSYGADVIRFASGPQTIVRFPHLSRLGIFGRAQSKPFVDAVIAELVSALGDDGKNRSADVP